MPFVLASIPLVVLIIVAASRHPRGRRSGEIPVFRQRINAELATLKAETLENSILNIITNDQQYHGYITEALGADINLEQMLAARRVVKVLEDVKALPPGKRRAACIDMFTQALGIHTNAYRVMMSNVEDPSSPQNKQSLLASQIGLCAAMFTAADLGLLDVLSNEFAQLDWFQNEVVEKRMVRNASAYDGVMGQLRAHVTRYYAVPDNRFQLNVLRLAASRHVKAEEEMLGLVDAELRTNRVQVRSMEIPVTAWDAHTTWFEQIGPVRSPMDTREGVTHYVFLEWLHDSDSRNKDLQQQLIHRLRELIFGK